MILVCASLACALHSHTKHANLLWIGPARSVSRLREVLSAKEHANEGTSDGGGSEDHLSRAINELCHTRIEAADMRSRCGMLIVCAEASL